MYYHVVRLSSSDRRLVTAYNNIITSKVCGLTRSNTLSTSVGQKYEFDQINLRLKFFTSRCSPIITRYYLNLRGDNVIIVTILRFEFARMECSTTYYLHYVHDGAVHVWQICNNNDLSNVDEGKHIRPHFFQFLQHFRHTPRTNTSYTFYNLSFRFHDFKAKIIIFFFILSRQDAQIRF